MPVWAAIAFDCIRLHPIAFDWFDCIRLIRFSSDDSIGVDWFDCDRSHSIDSITFIECCPLLRFVFWCHFLFSIRWALPIWLGLLECYPVDCTLDSTAPSNGVFALARQTDITRHETWTKFVWLSCPCEPRLQSIAFGRIRLHSIDSTAFGWFDCNRSHSIDFIVFPVCCITRHETRTKSV